MAVGNPGDVEKGALKQFEFQVLRWVPDVRRGEFINIGVLLRDVREHGAVLVRFTKSWKRLRSLTGDLECDFLEALTAELAQRLTQLEQDGYRRSLLDVVQSSFSTGLQATEFCGLLATDIGERTLEREMERLMQTYVNSSSRQATGGEVMRGRSALLGTLRSSLKKVGVLDLLRKGFSASEYTGPGDSLRIDFGYRMQRETGAGVGMLHAVSLQHDVEGAKALAFSAGRLRQGIRRLEGAELELTAVIEPENTVSSAAGWRYAVAAMRDAGIAVETTAQVDAIASAVRQQLMS